MTRATDGAELAGRMRERVRIERATGPGAAWVEVGRFHAAADPLDPGPDAAAQARAAMPRWRFTLRGAPPMRPGDRVEWRGSSLTVERVQERIWPEPITHLDTEERR